MSDFGTSAYLVMPPEAVQLIEQLREQPLEAIGQAKDWMTYHHNVEKLNLQAHQSAQRKHDNFVVESLLTYQKFPVLILNLLSTEMWKANVFPLLKCQDSDSASLRLYYIIYHEAALVNLFEVAFFHEHVIETLDDDMMLEIIDYCMRKITWLIGLPRDAIATNTTWHKSGDEIIAMMQSQTPRTELQRQQMEIEFRIAVQSVTLLRYIAERLHMLPLSTVSRLLDKHDVLLSLAVLVENPPWTHKVSVKDDKTRDVVVKWKKFSNQKWGYVEPSDLLVLTPTEAQVWLAVYYLICTKSAREHYEITQYRKDQLLRMRKYLNELLLDQLPLLSDIQRYLDELAIMQVQSTAVGAKNTLVMEAIPYIRDNLARKYRKGFVDVAQHFDAESSSFTRTDDIKQLAELYRMEGIDELLEESEDRQKEREALRTAMQENMKDPECDEIEEPVEPTQVVLAFDNRGTSEKAKSSRPLIVEIVEDEEDNEKTALADEVIVVCDVDFDSQQLIETKAHSYYRYNLRPQPSASTQSQLVHRNALAKAIIEFTDAKRSVELPPTHLHLPQTQFKREKLWKQLGSLQEESCVVVQCQLISHHQDDTNQEGDPAAEAMYHVGALFLSIPLNK